MIETYEEYAYRELQRWERKLLQKPSMVQKFSKDTQIKLNQMLPNKVHAIITDSIKKMVEFILTGSDYLTKEIAENNLSLKAREDKVQEVYKKYKKTAMIEGAGTGAGGILLGIADFPLLLSIKVKFLFECAAIYGFNGKSYEERVFILLVFQLAYSSYKYKEETLTLIKNWDKEKDNLQEIDWRTFQQEYRDHLDIVKLLQMVPGIGAVVGVFANSSLFEHLLVTTMNSYRLRVLDR